MTEQPINDLREAHAELDALGIPRNDAEDHPVSLAERIRDAFNAVTASAPVDGDLREAEAVERMAQFLFRKKHTSEYIESHSWESHFDSYKDAVRQEALDLLTGANILALLPARTPEPDADVVEQAKSVVLERLRNGTLSAKSLVDDLAAANLLRAPAGRPDREAVAKRWKHVKRGSTYIEIGRGSMQSSLNYCLEGADIVFYRSEADGRLWARPAVEFDGRFEPLPPAPARGGEQ